MSFQDVYGGGNGGMPMMPFPYSGGPMDTGGQGLIARGLGGLYSGAKALLPAMFPAQAAPAAAPGTRATVPDVLGGAYNAPATPSPMASAFNQAVPMPQPRPPGADAPMSLAPPSPGPMAPPQGGQQAQDPGLIGRFVTAMRGAQQQAPQYADGRYKSMGRSGSYENNYDVPQQSMGLLPRMWNDISGISKAFGAGGSTGPVSPFNTTGSLY